jgi:hypothetical protein
MAYGRGIGEDTRIYTYIALTEPVRLSQESTNNESQTATRYTIPEACAKIAYSIISGTRDALSNASSICKTRVTYDTLEHVLRDS